MGSKILVIDNDKELVESMKRILKRSLYDVQTAENGKEGLTVLKSFWPDLVLLELTETNECSCTEFLQKFRTLEADYAEENQDGMIEIPFIFITDSEDVIHNFNGLHTKNYACLLKPAEPDELRECVSEKIERAQQQLEAICNTEE